MAKIMNDGTASIGGGLTTVEKFRVIELGRWFKGIPYTKTISERDSSVVKIPSHRWKIGEVIFRMGYDDQH